LTYNETLRFPSLATSDNAAPLRIPVTCYDWLTKTTFPDETYELLATTIVDTVESKRTRGNQLIVNAMDRLATHLVPQPTGPAILTSTAYDAAGRPFRAREAGFPMIEDQEASGAIVLRMFAFCSILWRITTADRSMIREDRRGHGGRAGQTRDLVRFVAVGPPKLRVHGVVRSNFRRGIPLRPGSRASPAPSGVAEDVVVTLLPDRRDARERGRRERLTGRTRRFVPSGLSGRFG
jgi:hypothetical protein